MQLLPWGKLERLTNRVTLPWKISSVVVKADKKLLTVLFPDGRDGRAFTLKVLPSSFSPLIFGHFDVTFSTIV